MASLLLETNVLYHFPFIGDKLIIGKFCALARGIKFIMNGANHNMAGFSTYPFQIFGNGWDNTPMDMASLPYKGDTVIGNDVWIGYEALIMPGVKIGNGAIISSRSVVVSDIPAYTIVGGNPAKALRQRFAPEVIAALEELAWWDWPVDKISRNINIITAGDIAVLQACV